MKKYIFENGISMPLCCIEDNIYFDYLTGQVITNENILKFIEKGLANKSLKIKEIDFVVYSIERYIMPTYDKQFLAYNYLINGCSNFLDYKKQPLDEQKRQYIVDGLINGEFKQEIIWGDISE